MKTLVLFQCPILHPETGSLLFSKIYLLAFLVVMSGGLIMGYRRQIPFSRLCLSSAFLVLLFILGTKAFALSAADWHELLSHGQWPAHDRKTMLGGLAGLAAGILVLGIFTRDHRKLLDIASAIIPLGMAVQRMGCLLSGCCFGTPTSLPWGIRYSPSSHAWVSQVDSGLIPPDASCSLPVHPTQVYDLLACLVILLLVLRFGKYLKAAGSRLLLAIILYGIFRFLVEFVRDPGSDFFPGMYLGIKHLQWEILLGTAVLAIIILLRERMYKAPQAEAERVGSSNKTCFLTVILLALFLGTRNLYDMAEKLVLLTLLLPVTAIATWHLFRRITVPGLRWTTGLMAAGIFMLTSQVILPKSPEEKVRYIEISAGSATGLFYNTYQRVNATLDSGGGCGGPYKYYRYYFEEPHNFRHQTYVGGLQLDLKRNASLYRRSDFGIGFFMGSETASVSDTNLTFRHLVWVINPFYQYDWRWFGLRGGFYAGTFNFVSKEIEVNLDNSRVGDNTGEMQVFNFFPQASLRFGPYDIVFAEVHLTDHFPQGNPVWPVSAGLGTGLGKLDGTRIGAGYSTSGVYAECYLPIKDKFVVRGSAADNFKKGISNRWSVSVGFGLRMGYKTINSKP